MVRGYAFHFWIDSHKNQQIKAAVARQCGSATEKPHSQESTRPEFIDIGTLPPVGTQIADNCQTNWRSSTLHTNPVLADDVSNQASAGLITLLHRRPGKMAFFLERTTFPHFLHMF